MKGTLLAINVTLAIFIYVAYCIGIILILTLKRHRQAKIRHLLWLNLSGVIIIIYFAYLTKYILYVLDAKTKLADYILTSITYVWLSFQTVSMLLINVDRLLEVQLNIKYPLYVTPMRMYCIIAFMWISGCAVCVAVMFIAGFQDLVDSKAHVIRIFSSQVSVVVDSLFLFTTVVIYTIIFHHFAQSRSQPCSFRKQRSSVGMWRTFRRSKFYTSFTVMLSYVLFLIVPDIVALTLEMTDYNLTVRDTVQHGIGLTTKISYLLDIFIFVYMDVDIRRLLRRRAAVWLTEREMRRCVTTLSRHTTSKTSPQTTQF